MDSGPSVSVIIPTHQRREFVRRALISLGGQSVDPSSFEVLVSVDGSTDGTAEMLAGLSTPFRLRSVSGPQRGRAGACNAAIAEAGGEVLIVLDDDMEAAPELVECHRRHHPAGSSNCVLGGVPVTTDDSSPLAARYVQAKFATHLDRLHDPEHRNLPRSFYTGNTSLRLDLMEEVGGFDESFTAYGNEDVELALRLRAAGAEIGFDPQARAVQRYGKDLRGLARDTFDKGRTTVLLARSHPEVFAALRLAAPRDSSRPWLAMRSVLLPLTGRRPRVAEAFFRLAAALERAGLWRQPLFYRVVLDYAFWAGVRRDLRESDRGDLESLRTELNRGPIDLLLHG